VLDQGHGIADLAFNRCGARDGENETVVPEGVALLLRRDGQGRLAMCIACGGGQRAERRNEHVP